MKASSDLFEGIAQSPVDIRGQACLSPAFYRDLGLMMAVMTCDLKVARALLPSPRLKPLALLPGVGLVGINCFEYRDTDLGPYNEVGVSVAVQVDGTSTPGWLSAARSNLSRRYHGFVASLPVNTQIAVHGGLDFFNYPKYLARIGFATSADRWACTLRDPADDQQICSFDGARLADVHSQRAAAPRRAEFFSYPVMEGRLLRARFVLDMQAHASTYFGSAFRVHPTRHPRCAALAALAPGRLLYYLHAPRCQGILFPPDPI